MITITRKFSADIGHRVFGHEGKCAMLHGHTYSFLLTYTAGRQDSLGRIVDFSVIKEHVGAFLDTYWDHKVVLYEKDPLCEILEDAGQKVFRLSTNPTAENLATDLGQRFAGMQLAGGQEINLVSVRCQETPNCYADYRAPFYSGRKTP